MLTTCCESQIPVCQWDCVYPKAKGGEPLHHENMTDTDKKNIPLLQQTTKCWVKDGADDLEQRV
jgi:hypothetical protein